MIEEALNWKDDRINELKQQHDALMKELIAARDALYFCANRKECQTYECCASCGPIYEAEEALSRLDKFLTLRRGNL